MIKNFEFEFNQESFISIKLWTRLEKNRNYIERADQLNYQTSVSKEKPLPRTIYYIWNYLEWGGAQVLFFGLMKEAKKYAKVKAIMPDGSSEQLLKFLTNLNIPSNFFAAHTDSNPASTLKRKIERHWNKLYSEFVLIRYLRSVDLKDVVIHTELAPWQSMWALIWLCQKAPVFVTMHNSLPTMSKLRFLLIKLKFQVLSRVKNFHMFTAITADLDRKDFLKNTICQKTSFWYFVSDNS